MSWNVLTYNTVHVKWRLFQQQNNNTSQKGEIVEDLLYSEAQYCEAKIWRRLRLRLQPEKVFKNRRKNT